MFTNPIDPFVLARIQYRVRSLIRRFGLTRSEFDDLKQELIVAVLVAMPSFNPGKALRETFIRRVLDRRCSDLIRRWRADKRHVPGTTLSLDGAARQLRHDIVIDRRRPSKISPLERFELRHDLNVMLVKLPTRLLSIACLITDHSTPEIAQRLALAPRTVRREVQLLPRFFDRDSRKEDFFKSVATSAALYE